MNVVEFGEQDQGGIGWGGLVPATQKLKGPKTKPKKRTQKTPKTPVTRKPKASPAKSEQQRPQYELNELLCVPCARLYRSATALKFHKKARHFETSYQQKLKRTMVKLKCGKHKERMESWRAQKGARHVDFGLEGSVHSVKPKPRRVRCRKCRAVFPSKAAQLQHMHKRHGSRLLVVNR